MISTSGEDYGVGTIPRRASEAAGRVDRIMIKGKEDWGKEGVAKMKTESIVAQGLNFV